MEKMKNNKWRRIPIGVLLTFALLIMSCLAVLPITVSAAEGDVEINATNFPDDNFRSWITENIAGADDGVLTAEEIAAVTKINVNKKGIADMKGIELFTNLKDLNCGQNDITSLDVSANTKLVELFCGWCENLSSLNITGCVSLRYLTCRYCNLAEIDVSTNTNLWDIRCENNENLTSLDLSANLDIKYVDCCDCSLTELIFDETIGLGTLHCNGNNLVSLDLSVVQDCYDVEIGDQTSDITINADATFDMNSLGIDLTKVTVTSEGHTMDANGVICVGTDAVITYIYDIGIDDSDGNDYLMAVTLNITNPHEHAFDIMTGACVCGEKRDVSVTIGDISTFYLDFVEALAAANTGTKDAPATIILYADAIREGKDYVTGVVKLDLNGFTLDIGEEWFTNSGTLELCDSGVGGSLVGNASPVLKNSGFFTLTSGTIKVKDGSGILARPVWNDEGGEIVINGGTVSRSFNGSINSDGGKITINGGTVDELKYCYDTELVVNGGVITSISWERFGSFVTLDITGGTIGILYISNYDEGGHLVEGEAMDFVTISGGTVTKISVSGGSVADCLATGYVFYDEAGTRITLTEGQEELTGTVTVAECTDHEGGTATCTTLALCELCGLEYGELAPDNHLYDNVTCICTLCGKFSFAGTGTEDDPYMVSSGEQLQAALNSTDNEINYIKVERSFRLDDFDIEATTTPFILDLNGAAILGGFVEIGTNATIKGEDYRFDSLSVYIRSNAEVMTYLYGQFLLYATKRGLPYFSG